MLSGFFRSTATLLTSQKLAHHFSTEVKKLSLPCIDLSSLFTAEPSVSECNKLVKALETYGAAIISDPRVNQYHNNQMLDMMEYYF
jgi:hypothetical protein